MRALTDRATRGVRRVLGFLLILAMAPVSGALANSASPAAETERAMSERAMSERALAPDGAIAQNETRAAPPKAAHVTSHPAAPCLCAEHCGAERSGKSACAASADCALGCTGLLSAPAAMAARLGTPSPPAAIPAARLAERLRPSPPKTPPRSALR